MTQYIRTNRYTDTNDDFLTINARCKLNFSQVDLQELHARKQAEWEACLEFVLLELGVSLLRE